MDWIFLALGLFIILAGCEIFTNGIEWFGKRMKIGEGVLGSIFSAVGTCLPETMVPLIALFLTQQTGANEDISVGAIIGAPFMLSTLAMFITGISVVSFERRRMTQKKLMADRRIIVRDLLFFIFLFGVGIASAFIDDMLYKRVIAGVLVFCYFIYVIVTVKRDTYEQITPRSHYLSSLLGTRPRLRYILLQLVLALGAIGWGAHLFIMGLEGVSLRLRLPALLLSLILTPVATELPEKLNSVIWISRRKDTLALGNITGAMAFQGSIPVAIGMSFTAWDISGHTMISAAVAMFMAIFLTFWLAFSKKPGYKPLLLGGVMYLCYTAYLAVYVFI